MNRVRGARPGGEENPDAPPRTVGWFGLAYALASTAAVLVSLAWFVGFLAAVLPRSVDAGPRAGVAAAATRDVAVLALFGLQHSVMARPAVKRALARVTPPDLERSTYVLLSSLLLALVMWQWRPIAAVVWRVDAPVGALLLRALFAAGLLEATLASWAIDAGALLGVRQAIAGFRGMALPPPRFATPGPYGLVRHPIQSGTLVALWAAPVMTMGHALLAAVFTAYVLIALRYEERDLEREFGATYAAYRQRVPALLPRLRRRAG